MPIRRDWWSKSLAGVILGFTLAMACSGVLARLCDGLPLGVRAQLAMWLVVPVWFATLGLCFLFGSGRRAWLWLGLANVLGYGLLALLRLS